MSCTSEILHTWLLARIQESSKMGPCPQERVESNSNQFNGAGKVASDKRFRPRPLLLIALVALVPLLGCAPDALQSTFGTAGPVAEKQLLLFNVLL